ncbi:MAG: type IV secretory system conjugative DNA transfer family protein [Solirubrobacterales bacterium]
MSGVGGFAGSLAFVAAIVGAVELVRLAARGAVRWVRGRSGADPLAVRIGTRAGARRRQVALGLDELQQGVLVGGSPGAGKSTLLAGLNRRLPDGVGSLFLDLKGDRSMAGRLGIPAERVFGLGDRVAAAWNPLEAGNPASWRDILMATQHWSEPHYRQAAARYVGACLTALGAKNGAVELDDVISLLEAPKRATGALRSLPEAEGAILARASEAISAEASLRSGVLGLANRLALLCDSAATAGRFGRSGGIDLAAVLRGERVLFSLPAAEFPEEAPAIAAALIQSFGAAGQRVALGDESLRALLVIDEAPRLGGEQLREAVAIGRGAGIGTVVSVQDFADLDYIAPGTREAVETGANTWIVMRQVASAERIANAFGSQTTKRQTVQLDASRFPLSDTGMRSEREVEEYRISPNVIRGLGRGEALVWRRLRNGRLDRVHVRQAPRTADRFAD